MKANDSLHIKNSLSKTLQLLQYFPIMPHFNDLSAATADLYSTAKNAPGTYEAIVKCDSGLFVLKAHKPAKGQETEFSIGPMTLEHMEQMRKTNPGKTPLVMRSAAVGGALVAKIGNKKDACSTQKINDSLKMFANSPVDIVRFALEDLKIMMRYPDMYDPSVGKNSISKIVDNIADITAKDSQNKELLKEIPIIILAFLKQPVANGESRYANMLSNNGTLPEQDKIDLRLNTRGIIRHLNMKCSSGMSEDDMRIPTAPPQPPPREYQRKAPSPPPSLAQSPNASVVPPPPPP
ncbi:MAG: hypothetical protein LBT64_03250, partial [Puniceicoccales bacterium]|nr:hypothetical protein [Puniceicoccales bacterium]